MITDIDYGQPCNPQVPIKSRGKKMPFAQFCTNQFSHFIRNVWHLFSYTFKQYNNKRGKAYFTSLKIYWVINYRFKSMDYILKFWRKKNYKLLP